MCDYSISAASQRAAKVSDKLVSTQFGVTRGFAAVGEPSDQAICLLPGTELALDEAIHGHKVAKFVQIDLDSAYRHHDAIELPGGKTFLLNSLDKGTTATVLQLPAAPRNAEEAKEQERVEQVA